jgi:hypothetical protein
MTKGYLIKCINTCTKVDQIALKQDVDNKTWGKITRKNALVLKSIVLRYGWPTVSLVGKLASRNAWLIVQHADHDIGFQRKCLKLMENIFKENPNDVSVENIAFLTDRVLVNKGEKQIYGTQLQRSKDGQLIPRPIKTRRGVDERRKEVGLETLEEYIRRANRQTERKSG